MVCRSFGRSCFRIGPYGGRCKQRGALFVADGPEAGVVESCFPGYGYFSDLSGAGVCCPFVRFVASLAMRGFVWRSNICLAAGRWLYLCPAPYRDLNRSINVCPPTGRGFSFLCQSKKGNKEHCLQPQALPVLLAASTLSNVRLNAKSEAVGVLSLSASAGGPEPPPAQACYAVPAGSG